MGGHKTGFQWGGNDDGLGETSELEEKLMPSKSSSAPVHRHTRSDSL